MLVKQAKVWACDRTGAVSVQDVDDTPVCDDTFGTGAL